MAQIKLLKIGSTGFPTELDSTADDLTMNSFTVNSGPAITTNIDMNNGNVSDVNDLSFTDPTADGITVTDGTHAADSIVMEDSSNVFATSGGIAFPAISDAVGEVDSFRVPALAGVPSATPTNGGEGHLVWDSSNDSLYAWDGAAWQNQSQATEASTSATNYTSGEILAVRDVVYISAADAVSKADASAESTSRVVGFAKAGVGSAASVDVVTHGALGGFTGLTAGASQYLSETAGLLSETVPTTSGANIVKVGYAKSTTDVQINFQHLGIRA